jgi:hypothetical protein
MHTSVAQRAASIGAAPENESSSSSSVEIISSEKFDAQNPPAYAQSEAAIESVMSLGVAGVQ